MLVKIRVARHLYIPDLEGKNLYFGAGVHNVDDGLLKSFLAKRLIEKKIIVIVEKIVVHLAASEQISEVKVEQIKAEQIDEVKIEPLKIKEFIEPLPDEIAPKKEDVFPRGRKKYKGSLADEDK